MQAGRQAGRQPGLLTALDCPGQGQVRLGCQLLLVSMSACSIYTHPRALPEVHHAVEFWLRLVTLRSLFVLLALLVLLAFPAFLPFWTSCPGPLACISACQGCLPPDNPPDSSATPGDPWVALLRSTRPAKHNGIRRKASSLSNNCTLCTLKP